MSKYNEDDPFVRAERISRALFTGWVTGQTGFGRIVIEQNPFCKHDCRMVSGQTNSVVELKVRNDRYSGSTLLIEWDKYKYLVDYSSTDNSLKYRVRPYYANIFSDRIVIFNLFTSTVNNWGWSLQNSNTAGNGEKEWKLVAYLNQRDAMIYLLNR